MQIAAAAANSRSFVLPISSEDCSMWTVAASDKTCFFVKPVLLCATCSHMNVLLHLEFVFTLPQVRLKLRAMGAKRRSDVKKEPSSAKALKREGGPWCTRLIAAAEYLDLTLQNATVTFPSAVHTKQQNS